jgi:hypothetical protein
MLFAAAIEDVFTHRDAAKYPNGMNAGDILTEVRAKYGADAYPYCTIIDVCDEMDAMYGKPGKRD